MDKSKSSAPRPTTESEDTPHGCYGGQVYIGHLVEEDGEEIEVFESVPCRRCASNAGVSR